MKPITISSRYLLIALTALGISIALVSWDFKQEPDRYRKAVNDTVPKTKSGEREKKILDLDDVLDELNNADMKLDMEKIEKEIREAMKNFDGDKLRLDIEKAMKEVDVDRIRKEVEESMNKIDWAKMKKEIGESLAKIDWDKMKKEIDESMDKVDWENMKKDMEELKYMKLDKLDVDLKQMEKELRKLGPEMEKAKKEIEKAKVDLKEYKEFVNGLQADGLINKKEGYTIKHKNGELFVNGKKVSNEVYSRYRSFLEKHATFSIEKNDDDFDIDMD